MCPVRTPRKLSIETLTILMTSLLALLFDERREPSYLSYPTQVLKFVNPLSSIQS